MADTNVSTGRGYIWLPTYKDKLHWKAIITVSDTEEYDITNYMKLVTIHSLDLRHGNSTCTIDLDNGDGRYLDKFSGGEKIEIWVEYTSGAFTPSDSNKLYRGKLDNIFFSADVNGYAAVIDSRQVPEGSDKLIIEQYSNQLISDAIKDIANKYLNGIITVNNVAATTGRITTTFRHVSPFKAIGILLEKAGQDGYIDTDMDLHTFNEGSVISTTDMIAFGNNLASVSRYGTDNNALKNKVIVYGNEKSENLLLLKTEEDTDSQSALWEKTLVVQDQSLETMEEVQERADRELSNQLNYITGGSFEILGSPSVNPGEYIKTSVPYVGVVGNYKMFNITHILNLQVPFFSTNIELQRESNTMGGLFKERIDVEEQLRKFSNLNYMENSYTVFFTELPVKWSLSNCIINEGILRLTAGQSAGEIDFTVYTADKNITKCELRISSNFPDTENDVYLVSNDGGYRFEEIRPGIVHQFLTSTGKKLKFKIRLNGDATHNPAYDGVSLLYK